MWLPIGKLCRFCSHILCRTAISIVIVCCFKIYVNNKHSRHFSYCSFHISLSKAFWQYFLITCFFELKLKRIRVKCFYVHVARNEILAGSDIDKEFPHRPPIVKIAHFGKIMSIDMMLPRWAIFTMGVCGDFFHFLSNPTEISFLTA